MLYRHSLKFSALLLSTIFAAATFVCIISAALLALAAIMLPFHLHQDSQEYIASTSNLVVWSLGTLLVAYLTRGLSQQLLTLIRRERSRLNRRKVRDFFDKVRQGTAPEYFLYLRPFALEKASEQRWLRRWRASMADISFEPALARAAKPSFIVKIGGGESRFEELGSLSVHDKDWFDEFVPLAKSASKIMLVPIAQKGTLREIDFLFKNELFEKTILIMPQELYVSAGAFSDFPHTTKISEAWNESIEILASNYDLHLPRHQKKGGLLVQDKDEIVPAAIVGLRNWHSHEVLKRALRLSTIETRAFIAEGYLRISYLFYGIITFMFPLLQEEERGGIDAYTAALFFPTTVILLTLFVFKRHSTSRNFDRLFLFSIRFSAVAALIANLAFYEFIAGWGYKDFGEFLAANMVAFICMQLALLIMLFKKSDTRSTLNASSLQKGIRVDIHTHPDGSRQF
ncbi:MAG: hypothetical protein MRY64_04350 [Hyphomonadaceae bacterium]|nr:hypothetical protein [Hyphomonadaceae bacterium]